MAILKTLFSLNSRHYFFFEQVKTFIMRVKHKIYLHFFLPLIASIAAAPVSPDVATIIFIFLLFLLK